MASAVAGYRTSLGSDGPPCCYDDLDHADVILVIGANPAEAHPVLFDRIRAARKAHPERTLIVADPRRSLTARPADLHLPVRPGGDVALLNALGRLLLDAGAADKGFIAAHTSGFEAYREFLLAQDVAVLSRACGVALPLLEETARRIAAAKGFLRASSASTAWG
jgi:ferredoxin-nitrate reductase